MSQLCSSANTAQLASALKFWRERFSPFTTAKHSGKTLFSIHRIRTVTLLYFKVTVIWWHIRSVT